MSKESESEIVPATTKKRSRSKSGSRKSVGFRVETKNDEEKEILELESFFKDDWKVSKIPPDQELIAWNTLKKDESLRKTLKVEHKLLTCFLEFKTQSVNDKNKSIKSLGKVDY